MSHKSLTRRGYVVKKKNLKPEDHLKIQKELCFKPFVIPAFMDFIPEKKFYTYLESVHRYYLPRYYGLATFGPPDKNLLYGAGEDTDYKVFWDILPHQNSAWGALQKKYIEEKSGGIMSLYCGGGKCLAKDTPILMHDGTFKMSQDIQPGDLLMGDDSSPRTVLGINTGQEMMYEVIPTKGDSYTVNESHILSLIFSSDYRFKGKQYRKGDKIDLPLKEFIELPSWWHERGGVLRGYRVPVTFSHKEVELDPYILGHWLGDGTSHGAMFTTKDKEIIEYYTEYCKKYNLRLKILYDKRRAKDDQIEYKITTGTEKEDGSWFKNDNSKNKIYQGLKKYGVLNNKHVPMEYKCNSREIQLQVLAGLIDSDGHLSHNGYDFTLKHEQLIDDIIYIARSLGFAAYKRECQKTCTNATSKKAIRKNPDDKIGKVTNTYYRTCIHGAGLEEIPVKLRYKKASPRKQIKNALVTKIQVKKLEVDNYYGFELDGNGRFLLGDFQVTHNTFLAIKLGSVLKKKMLVIVNKEFLMNQWKEAIQKCSNARVGIIQQKKVDIENKDIVIGMLHSVCKIDYPEGTFDGFGFCVVDECHHIASQMFSQALPKIATQHMLGLSATPERKDGLTPVFLNYLGPIFHKERRKGANQVWIKFLEVASTSEHYQEEVMEKSGTKNTVKMINNISNFETMNYLILDLVRILVKNKPRKIIILGKRREQLEWLNSHCQEGCFKNSKGKYATCGLYYGNKGLRKDAYYKMLEESAKCDIIFGTNEIAAEGLDIPGLNTLILLQGGHDVEQAVGRILRKLHKEVPPTVIDMVYKCGNFPKHAKKRRDYYNYESYCHHPFKIRIGDDQASINPWLPKLEEFLENYSDPKAKNFVKEEHLQELVLEEDEDDQEEITKSKKGKSEPIGSCVIESSSDDEEPNSNSNSKINLSLTAK